VKTLTICEVVAELSAASFPGLLATAPVFDHLQYANTCIEEGLGSFTTEWSTAQLMSWF